MKYYSMTELVNSFIDEYKLTTSGDSDAYKQNYRQKISRTLKEMHIWEKGKAIKKGKRTSICFTEEQRLLLLSNQSFYDYIRDRSEDDAILKSKRYKDIQNEISERREEHINNYLNSQSMGKTETNDPYISNKEFLEHKDRMMLKALFEKFFTPINDEMLLHDLYQVEILADELVLSTADIEAEQRLHNPEGHYYKRREDTEEVGE